MEDDAQLDRKSHMARALSFSSINVLVSSNNYLLAHQDKQISLPTDAQEQNRCYGRQGTLVTVGLGNSKILPHISIKIKMHKPERICVASVFAMQQILLR